MIYVDYSSGMAFNYEQFFTSCLLILLLLTRDAEHSFSSLHHVVRFDESDYTIYLQRERYSLESDGANGKLPLKPIIHFQTWRVGKF